MDSSASRVHYLYTGRAEEPRYFGVASPVSVQWPNPGSQVQSVGSPNYCYTSTASSRSLSSRDSVSSRESSSTSATSTVPRLNAPYATLNQHLLATPYRYGYNLPCEFEYIGCRVRYNPDDIDHWIQHSISHFVGGPLPSKAICTFCDDDEGVFESSGDRESNWHQRMMHIAGHFENLQREEELRPDFEVLMHMSKFGLISDEDLNHARRYTERPRGCPGIVGRGHRTSEMLRKDEKNASVRHDLSKESRERRRHKEEKLHRSSRTHREVNVRH